MAGHALTQPQVESFTESGWVMVPAHKEGFYHGIAEDCLNVPAAVRSAASVENMSIEIGLDKSVIALYHNHGFWLVITD